jgi:hypothetical protein
MECLEYPNALAKQAVIPPSNVARPSTIRGVNSYKFSLNSHTSISVYSVQP